MNIGHQTGRYERRLADAEWQPWTYTRKDGAQASIPHWAMPEALLDDPVEACAWAHRALACL